jgi:Domain of unknown function (DUF4258)
MAEPEPRQRTVTPFRLTPKIAEKRIHDAAADSDNIIFSDHAQDRMEERSIYDVHVLEILQTGHVVEIPTLTEYDEWKCKIVKKLKGAREAGVVTIIMHNGKLFIKTVEWEDFR